MIIVDIQKVRVRFDLWPLQSQYIDLKVKVIMVLYRAVVSYCRYLYWQHTGNNTDFTPTWVGSWPRYPAVWGFWHAETPGSPPPRTQAPVSCKLMVHWVLHHRRWSPGRQQSQRSVFYFSNYFLTTEHKSSEPQKRAKEVMQDLCLKKKVCATSHDWFNTERVKKNPAAKHTCSFITLYNEIFSTAATWNRTCIK